jgi:hypothetical protein
MSAAALSVALLALVPALIGPLPAAQQALTAKLCNGGTITIPLGKGNAPDEDRRCQPKGCHAGTCRDKGKRRI